MTVTAEPSEKVGFKGQVGFESIITPIPIPIKGYLS